MLYALSFLTAIPVRIKNYSEKKADNSLYYFVLTGALLGLLNSLVLILLFNTRLERVTMAVILTVFNTALTGGLHLDGLADLFDSFGAHDREKKLAIMKDSRTGTFGVLALVCLLALKTVFLMECLKNNNGIPALITASVTARFLMVWLIRVFPTARESGFATHFKGLINYKSLGFNTFIWVSIVIFLRADISVLFILLPVTAIIFTLSSGVSKSLKGLTGDVYGAMCEISELFILAFWSFLG